MSPSLTHSFIRRTRIAYRLCARLCSCHQKYQRMCLITQSCPTLCDPTDSSPPGSSVHGIFPGKYTRVGCHFLLHSMNDKCLSPLGAGDGRGALKGQQDGVRRGGTLGQAKGAVSMGQLGGPPGRWLDDCEAHGSQCAGNSSGERKVLPGLSLPISPQPSVLVMTVGMVVMTASIYQRLTQCQAGPISSDL